MTEGGDAKTENERKNDREIERETIMVNIFVKVYFYFSLQFIFKKINTRFINSSIKGCKTSSVSSLCNNTFSFTISQKLIWVTFLIYSLISS